MLEEAILQLDACRTHYKGGGSRSLHSGATNWRAPQNQNLAGEFAKAAARLECENLLPWQPELQMTRQSSAAIHAAASLLDGMLVDAFARLFPCHDAHGALRVYLSAHADEFQAARALVGAALAPLRRYSGSLALRSLVKERATYADVC